MLYTIPYLTLLPFTVTPSNVYYKLLNVVSDGFLFGQNSVAIPSCLKGVEEAVFNITYFATTAGIRVKWTM